MPPLIGVAIKATEAPEQIIVDGEAEMLTLATAVELTATDTFWIVPIQPKVFVSVTETVPLVVPNVTVIEFVFTPAVMLAPDGTVHA